MTLTLWQDLSKVLRILVGDNMSEVQVMHVARGDSVQL